MRQKLVWTVVCAGFLAGCPSGGDPPPVRDAGRTDTGGGGLDGGGDAGGGGCAAGELLCGVECVDVESNPAHCGACDDACGTGEICTAGACIGCGTGETFCGGTCTNTDSDRTNCGACGTVCDSGETCDAGTCTSGCPAPNMECTIGTGTGAMTVCLDVTTDSMHCGDCDTVCRGDQTCVAGACACDAGSTDCSGACVDTETDTANCGACGTDCNAAQSCTAGTCTCPGGTTECGATCTNTMTDSANCGSCGMACGTGTSCSAGACTAVCASMPGTTFCGGSCVNTQNDGLNCGACGTVCGSGTSCLGGACRPTNDLAAGATALVFSGSGELTVTGTTLNATASGPTEPATGACGCMVGPNVWYRLDLSERVIFYADTIGTGFDSSLYFATSTGAALTGRDGVLCNDDSGCGGGGAADYNDAMVAADLLPGTYYLVVGGCGSGAFTLHIQHILSSSTSFLYGPPLAGPASAFGVTSETFLTSGSRSTPPATCGAGLGASGEDVRWVMSCGLSTTASTFSVCPSDGGYWERGPSTARFDPVLYLYNGTTGTSSTCADDVGGCASSEPGADAVSYGSRISGVLTRGLNWVVVDERLQSGGGMNYRLVYGTY